MKPTPSQPHGGSAKHIVLPAMHFPSVDTQPVPPHVAHASYRLSSTPNTYTTSYMIAGVLVVSVTEFELVTSMQPVTHAPAGATRVVSSSPVGTNAPGAGHTPNASPPPKSMV